MFAPLGKPPARCHSGAVTDPTSPLQVPDYRKYWLARLSSVIGSTSIAVALGWQVYDVARADYGMSTGQAAFQLGIVGLVQFIPMLILAPLAGLVADRFDRRRVGAFAMFIDLLMAAALGSFTAAGLVTLPVLFVLASLNGVARAFFGPAMQSIAPNILPTQLIPGAIGLNSTAWQIGAVIGPALGGLLYAVSPALPYGVSAGLLALAIAAVLWVRPFPQPELEAGVHPLRQIFEGFRFIRHSPLLLGCVTLDLFAVILAGATSLLPVYARDILLWHGHPVGPMGLGQMRAAPAVGASIVALVLAFKPLSRNVGIKMLWSVAAFGALTIAFGLSRNYLLSLALLALLGAADMISVFVRGTLVQLSTPDEMRGRVSSISGLAISASNELGEMQSGVAAALLGATGAVVFGGIGAIVITAAWAVLFPQLRHSRTFSTHYASRKEQAT